MEDDNLEMLKAKEVIDNKTRKDAIKLARIQNSVKKSVFKYVGILILLAILAVLITWVVALFLPQNVRQAIDIFI